MTKLTPRQRVQVHAALALISSHGHDANAVQRTANQHMGRRLGAKSAYERALKDFIKDKPELAGQVRHTVNLIDNSTDETVSQYGAALDQYRMTGNEADIAGIAEIFMQDSVALAVRTGAMSEAEAAQPGAYDSFAAGSFGAVPNAQAPIAGLGFGNAREQSGSSGRASFTGKDGGSYYQQSATTHRAAFQEQKRHAAFAQANQRTSAEGGNGAVVEKSGWTPSNQFG